MFGLIIADDYNIISFIGGNVIDGSGDIVIIVNNKCLTKRDIGLIGKTKIRLSEIWQRMRFVVIFRLHGKDHKKFKCLWHGRVRRMRCQIL